MFLEGLNEDESQLFSRSCDTHEELRGVGCRCQLWSPKAEHMVGIAVEVHCFQLTPIQRLKQLLNSWQMNSGSEQQTGLWAEMGYQPTMRNVGSRRATWDFLKRKLRGELKAPPRVPGELE